MSGPPPLQAGGGEPDAALPLKALGIARRFGARWCLRGVTLELRPGEIVGLMGVNGSGKTTFLRILATLLKPTAGTACIYGHDIGSAPDAVRREIGFLAHTAGLYDNLTARENLRFAADMLGLRTPDAGAALERVGLNHAADALVRGFSAGMQRRMALARLILLRPRLLLLDEPYSNLDADGIGIMNSVIRDAQQAGGAALLVLHELAPAVGLVDRVITLESGRIAAPHPGDARRTAGAAAGGDS